jgi:hypothetical protein
MMRILALLIFAALRGRFAPMVANMGDWLRGFAQFESGKDGKLGVLRLTFAADGQAYEFSRD